MKASEVRIYCADIGSVRKANFGWAVVQGDRQRGGTVLAGLVEEVVGSLAVGAKMALGLECPLWVPVPDDLSGLTAGRVVDGNKPWSAGAGASALAAGLTETAWILREVRRCLEDEDVSPPPVYLDWQGLAAADAGIFLWEAFVTGAAKAATADDGHVADARKACMEFAARLPDPEAGSAREPALAVRSLIGVAVLWSGWSQELTFLRAGCLVVKPTGTAT